MRKGGDGQRVAGGALRQTAEATSFPGWGAAGLCWGTGHESLMTFPLTTQTITTESQELAAISGQTVGRVKELTLN